MLEETTDNPLVDLEVFYGRYMEFAAKHPEYFTLLYIDPAVPARVKDRPEDDSYGRLRGRCEPENPAMYRRRRVPC